MQASCAEGAKLIQRPFAAPFRTRTQTHWFPSLFENSNRSTMSALAQESKCASQACASYGNRRPPDDIAGWIAALGRQITDGSEIVFRFPFHYPQCTHK